MLLMIDNYDSFTYNLVQYFGELQTEVKVVKNDEITVAHLDALAPDYLVISPGPCTPNEAGISMQAVARFAGQLPILGICLGHQSIAQVFGASIVRANRVMHGKVSAIYHADQGVFAGLPNPFQATRYHSLVIEPASVPHTLEITAWTQNADGTRGEIMGIKHRDFAIEGVQFHPESILTERGHQLLDNFLNP
ncbi:MAG: aminodeoxychorismate/anthranilate synthase component II [Cellvibrionaceae bacterium]|nr:aminodeoxychorismate/anthranilate synthase component II [Cellvibrionaceae bacterium]